MSSKRRSPRIENVTANNGCNGTDDFDVVDYIAEVKDVESKYEWTPDQLKALDASDVTVKHKRRGEALEECFLNGIGLIKDKNGGQKWAKMLELVPNKDWKVFNQPKHIPRAFLVVSGEKTVAKVRLCNGMLVDWQIKF